MGAVISLSERRKALADATTPGARVRAAAADLTATEAERAVAALAVAIVGIAELPVREGEGEHAWAVADLAHDASQLARAVGPRGGTLAEALDALDEQYAAIYVATDSPEEAP